MANTELQRHGAEVILRGAEISISSATNVSQTTAVRIVNIGNAAVVNVAYSNGLVYANATITNNEVVYLKKDPLDTIVGQNMKAVPVNFLVNGYTFDSPPTSKEIDFFQYCGYDYVEKNPGYNGNTFVSYVGVYYNANGTLSSPYVANNQVEQY